MRLPHAVDRLVAAGAVEVRVVTAGVGSPAVLFDSALGTPIEAWSLIAPVIAEQTTVILWDRPGVGGSGPFVPLDAEGMASTMAAVVREVGATSVVAVGHSRGGIDVLIFAARHPELVSGLVLVESSHPDQYRRMGDRDGGLIRAAKLLAKAPRPLRQLPAWLLGGVVRLRGDRARPGAGEMATVGKLITARLDGFVAEHSNGPALLADTSRAIAERGIPDVPLVVLTGDHNFSDPSDQAKWNALQEELAALSRDSEHIHVACGHEMPFARPDAVIAAVNSVLARNPEKRG